MPREIPTALALAAARGQRLPPMTHGLASVSRGQSMRNRVAVFELRRIEVHEMVALLALVLILAIFGGLGFAAHVLWYVLIIAILLWLIGFFVGGIDGGGRRWYGR
jgi:hypothetical protein